MSPGQRGTAGTHARRVNTAAQLLASGLSVSDAARELTRRHAVSERQARRYAEQARDSGSTEVPKPKMVFTVKVPVDLLKRLRRYAKLEHSSLSSVVSQAFEDLLNRKRGSE